MSQTAPQNRNRNRNRQDLTVQPRDRLSPKPQCCGRRLSLGTRHCRLRPLFAPNELCCRPLSSRAGPHPTPLPALRLCRPARHPDLLVAPATSSAGLTPEEAAEKPYIASMGIYVFKKSVLTKLLNEQYPKVRELNA